MSLDQIVEECITPLYFAAEANKPESIKELLKLGADPNPHNEHGVSALQVAAILGHTKIIEVLIDAGVSVFTINIPKF